MMTVDEFLYKLNRPNYVYRMAKAVENSRGMDGELTALAKGAPKRLKKAEAEIDELIMQYAGIK